MPGSPDSLTDPISNTEVSASRGLSVLAVIATEEVSGPGRQLTAVARALQQRGVHVHLAILHRKGRPLPAFETFVRDAGVPVHRIPDAGPLDYRVARSILELATRIGADILQTHSYKATAAACLLRLSSSRLPWVGFYHGHTTETVRARLYHWLDRQMLRRADRVVVMSSPQKRLFHGLDDRVSVIYNAVAPLADISMEIANLRADAGVDRIAVIGRLSPEKGVDVFLDACARLSRSGRAFHAFLIGDGPSRSQLEMQVSRLSLTDHVTFLGHMNVTPALYGALDLVVIPSRTEGLPNVLLEAIGCGVPVVSTAVGAVPDVLSGSDAGIMVPIEEPNALADAIRRMLDRRQDSAVLRSQEQLRARFSLESRVESHIRLYSALIRTSI